MEGVMFNMKFTYKKMFHGISDLAEWYKTCWKHSKNVSDTAKYSKCNTHLSHNSNVIPITDLCNMLTFMSPVTRKAYVSWSQIQVISVFEILLLVV